MNKPLRPGAELIRAARGPLLDWFDQSARDLPWRRNRSAYRVWISELMLQQTRVDQALPYYQRFMRKFPSLRRLAEAPLDEVLKAWEGLGYYARARNLHRAARVLVAEQGGRFPRNAESLRALPGVGAYTAAAIASLVYGEAAAVVDGNVIRVLSRLFAYKQEVSTAPAKRQFQDWADALIPPERPGAFNEAMMELGATLCTPRKPDCPSCPLKTVCRAAQAGTPEAYPVKRKKKPVPTVEVGAAVLRDTRGRLLIARRFEKGLLGGMWEFPGGKVEPGESVPACIAREMKEELGIEVEVGDYLMEVRHTYSHFKLHMHLHWARIRKGRPRAIECADFAWCSVEEFEQYAFSKADLLVVERLREEGEELGAGS